MTGFSPSVSFSLCSVSADMSLRIGRDLEANSLWADTTVWAVISVHTSRRDHEQGRFVLRTSSDLLRMLSHHILNFCVTVGYEKTFVRRHCCSACLNDWEAPSLCGG